MGKRGTAGVPRGPERAISTKGMIVLEQDREGARLLERRPCQPVALVGTLFLALALLPLISEGPVDMLRAITALSLALVAVLCFVLGLPRARRLPLPAVATTQRLVLSGTSNIEGYVVRAVPGSDRSVVLAGADPGCVLSDALALSALLGVPLEPGWGLDRDALRLLRSPENAPLLTQPLELRHRIVPDQAIGTGTTLWAALFIPSATTVLALSPARPSLTPTVLALVLPALTALYALVVGLWLLGLRETLTLEGGHLTRRRLWFKKPLGSALETPGVVGLYAVSPLGGRATHVLAATRNGPAGFSTDARAGEVVSQHAVADVVAAGRAAE